MTKMSATEAKTSSFARADLSRTTYCPDVTAYDNINDTLFDFMDIAFQRALAKLPVRGAVRWRKGASMTALSYDYYGVTNAWQLILAFNGFVSPSHIPSGATVNIPDITGLKAFYAKSNQGKVTRI